MSRSESFWMDRVTDARTARPPLEGAIEADVCIVGGGYTGLWTAYELRRAAPSLEVVVLEAERVGFGASGRNGGWVSGELAGWPNAWPDAGTAALTAQREAIEATVGEIDAVVARESIDCDWEHAGTVIVARSELELSRLRAGVEAGRRAGVPEADARLLDAEETRALLAIPGARGARFSPHCARVQPAKLVVGLAAAAERAGARIFEGTRVTAIEAGADGTHGGAAGANRGAAGANRGAGGANRGAGGPLVRAGAASVRARHVVLATEGYTAGLPGRERAVLPLNSAMIVTEPLGADRWAAIGWERAVTVLDGLLRYHYLQRTADGRIAIGGRGTPYRFGSATDRVGPLPPRTVQALRGRLHELFGAPLADVAVADSWGGVLGVSRDWTPHVWLDRASGIASAGGYVGEGVAAANLAGRTLRDLILGQETELTRLPWVAPPGSRQWEPEPLRWLGVHGVYTLYGLADAIERRSGRPSLAARLADLVAGR